MPATSSPETEPAVADAAGRDLLRVATAGSVDDGKSTLIGRLLLDARALHDDHVELAEAGDLAHLTDGLRAEREQGITIDVAYRYFTTGRRSFVLADTPGHEQHTRNMVTGASTADVALLLVDARHGVVRQTRRHAAIAALLGLRHVVAVVNKADLVDFDQTRLEEVGAEVRALTDRLGIADQQVIPVSALEGDNVVERSARTPWYDGPALLEHLEQLEVAGDRDLDRVRLPIQWVVRDKATEHRAYAGQLAGGVLAPGDEVVVLPQGTRTRVAAIDGPEGPVEEAFAPMAVSVRLEDEVDVGRGDLLADPATAPAPAREVTATLCWMDERALKPGGRYALKSTSRTVRAVVAEVRSRLDVASLEHEAADGLELNDLGDVVLRTAAPLLVDPYVDNRVTGAFILVDERSHATVAAGMVRETAAGAADALRSPDTTWHETGVSREERWTALGRRGATVWLTGLPASGKSTIAVQLQRLLVESGRPAYLLDGDNVRQGLSGDLGFDREGRTENVRRVGHVARLFADAGEVALVSLVSPFIEDRAMARELHDAAGLDFFEVWVDTPLEECARRDPKGLYAKAKEGRLPELTGDQSPYQRPPRPDATVHTAEEDAQSAAARLLRELLERLPADGAA